MNVGYVSRSFLDKIQHRQHHHSRRSIGGGINEWPSLSASSATPPPRTAYLLHLNSPSSSSSSSSIASSERGVVVIDDGEKNNASSCRVAGVGMPIRLLPLDHHLHLGDDVDGECRETADNPKGENVEQSAIVYLHPIMLHVLVTSSMMASESASSAATAASTMGGRWNIHSKQDENHTQTIIPVVLLPTIDNYYSTSRIAYEYDTPTGTLEMIDTYVAGNDHCENDGGVPSHTAIHLEYMCSTTTKGRNLYHTDNSRRQQVLLPLGGLEDQTFRNQLTGMTIVEGGIIGIDIDDDEVGVENGDWYNEDCGINRNVVFFMVNKIDITSDGGNATTRRARFLHISACCSYDIVLDHPSLRQADGDSSDEVDAVAETPNADSNFGITQRPSCRIDGSTLDPNHNNIHFICPGYESIFNELLSLARMMNNPDAYPSAVLLSGCSGVGKTRMASWFERELARSSGSSTSSSIRTSFISAKDILLGRSSVSFDRHCRDRGKVLHHRTEKHRNVNGNTGPNRLLIIDDLDAVIGDNDESDTSSIIESEQLRALDAIIHLMDDAINDTSHRCFVLGISRASWAQLPPRLARVGRFEKVVTMLPPTLVQRRKIFEFWLSTLLLHGEEITADNTARRWAESLAPRTAGCVASDIRRICADALTSAAARAQELPHTQSTSEVAVSWEDVKVAAMTCVPSQLSSMDVIPATLYEDDLVREYDHVDSKAEFELAWKNFGGFDEEKRRLYRTVVRPWKYHLMESESLSDRKVDGSVDGILGTSKPSGVLFHGPSGCGKSAAAMCLASSLGLHCVKVTASEVFNQWLGGSEAILRSIFSRARAASPCILFFDELDIFAVNREAGDSDATSGVQSRILTTLLNEMDGITSVGGMQGVLVVAATNRLDAIDAALLRPGRLEEHVLLSYPKSSCIHQILMIQTAKMPIDSSVDLVKLSDRLERSKASCAEIEGVCRDACMIAIRRCSGEELPNNLSVTTSDFDEATYRINRGTAHATVENCASGS